MQNGLGFENVDGCQAGATAVQGTDQCVGFDQFGARGVHKQGGRLHSTQVIACDQALGGFVEAQMQRQHIGFFKKGNATAGGPVAMLDGPRARLVAAPNHDIHAKGLAVSGHQLTNLAVSPNAQRFAPQHGAQPEIGRHGAGLQARLLPGTVFQVADVLWQSTGRGHDQGPGQLGGRDRRADTFGHGHAAFCAGGQIDVPTHPACLGNQLQARQFFDQGPRELGAFADQHDDVCVFQTHRQLPDALDGVGVDLGREVLEFDCAVEFAHCILVVVKDHNVHPSIVP